MPSVALHALVAARLADHPLAVPGADTLVLAAFEGADSVTAALAGTRPAARPPAPQAPEHAAPTHLASLTVEGFRGVGPPVTLELQPRPGLTLIVGRNGSGKSSLAEALEMVLTGANQRWEGRSAVWRDGWRNLHHAPPRLSATFRVDSRTQPLTVSRTWADGAAVDASQLSVDGRHGTLAEGWAAALRAYPPLLSHNELGRILEKPSELYDALSGILGLEELTVAQDVLRQLRLAAEHTVRDRTAEAKQIVSQLEGLDDERARAVVDALRATPWRLDDIDTALGRTLAQVDESSLLAALRGLSQLPVLDRDVVRGVVAELRAVQHDIEKTRGTDASRARETATLLRQALTLHSESDHDRACPVCGTGEVLTTQWRLATTQRIEELDREASTLAELDARVRRVRGAARALLSPPPAVLRATVPAGVDTRVASDAWTAWHDVPQGEDIVALATHLDTHAPRLLDAVSALRAAATAELERREDVWRPVARTVSDWLPLAREAETQRTRLPQLKAAEAWMRDQHESLRAERFAPIATEVQALWSDLRQSSNVTLGGVSLEGNARASTRRVELDVSIDGAGGSALGVMSQGELNCLALSLFLPRAAMPESPFRFIVIDDPVQAMDEVKVEGLARALSRVAQERQVVVLTHDERLPVALRRLQLEATVLEVSRREQSVVKVETQTDPVKRYIEDAMAVAQSHGVPAAAGRVVPGLCRLAIEAACGAAVWQRLVGKGASFADADARLQEPRTLNMWLALLLFEDVERAGDVKATLNRRGLAHAADIVTVCNSGSHSAVGNDAVDLVRKTEKLTQSIVAGAL